MKVNFAIIGLGHISQYYIEALKDHCDALIVSVCDLDESKEGRAVNLKCNYYKDYSKILANENIDCAIVLTPNDTHFKIVENLLKNKINVICEKPLTIDYCKTRKLINLARKNNLILFIAYHRRFNDGLIDLRQKISGKKIKAIHFRYLENIYDHSFGEKWYLNVAKSGGGCVLDNGINVIDILQYLLGNLSLEYSHIGYEKIHGKKIDTNAYMQFSSDTGSLATVELDWLYQGETKDISVYCDDGKIFRMDFLSGYAGFKNSLWHEYKNIIDYAIKILNEKKVLVDSGTLSASLIIDKIYQLKNSD